MVGEPLYSRDGVVSNWRGKREMRRGDRKDGNLFLFMDQNVSCAFFLYGRTNKEKATRFEMWERRGMKKYEN